MSKPLEVEIARDKIKAVLEEHNCFIYHDIMKEQLIVSDKIWDIEVELEQED